MISKLITPVLLFFADITGLSETKKTLINAINGSHVAHAQLFLGNEGSANLAMALAYARYVNCEDKQEHDGCGTCASCVQFNKLTHPDLHMVFPMASLEKVSKEEQKPYFLKHFRAFAQQQTYGSIHEWASFVGADNKQFNISVDEGRNIMQNVAMKPYLSPYKIVLIWLPELMNISTANAILKVLEEPPAQTLFLLVANDYEKLLATILSRCQMVKIRAFDDDEVESFLLGRQLCNESRAKQIAKISEGNMNKAIFLAGEEANDHHGVFVNWMRLCFGRKFADLLVFCEDVAKTGRERQKELLQYGMQILRDSLMSRVGANELVKQDTQEMLFIGNFAKTVGEEKIERLYYIINEAYLHIERNGNAKIVLFDTSIKMSVALK